MASNINYINVDESFPIAGQDNDSQGFRDNFATIKSSLASAKTEITNLQDNTAKLNVNNNFNQNEISNAKLRNTPFQILFNGNGTVEWLTGSPSNVFRVNSTWPKRVNPTNPFTVTTNQPVLVDIWTTDGITFYGHYYGNYVTIAQDDGII